MINFECHNCIHFPVCMLKDEATETINAYNSRIKDNESFRINLNCKYYASISVTKDVIYFK